MQVMALTRRCSELEIAHRPVAREPRAHDRALAYRSSLSTASVAVDWALLRALRPPRWRWPATDVNVNRAVPRWVTAGVHEDRALASSRCRYGAPRLPAPRARPVAMGRSIRRVFSMRTDGPGGSVMTAIRFDAHIAPIVNHAVLIAAFSS